MQDDTLSATVLESVEEQRRGVNVNTHKLKLRVLKYEGPQLNW